MQAANKIMNDEELVLLALNQDRRAFEQIVNKYKNMVYGLCYRVLRNEAAAEEAAQESFIKVWKNLKKWKGSLSSLSTWIYKITVNTCIDFKRKYARLAEQELKDNFSYETNKAVETREISRLVDDMLKELNDAQQMCLILYYKQEVKQQEIAKIMGVSVKSVESYLLRGKRRLAEIMDERGIKLTDMVL